MNCYLYDSFITNRQIKNQPMNIGEAKGDKEFMERKYKQLIDEAKDTLQHIPDIPPENLSMKERTAFSETVCFLKGIRDEDVERIDKKLLQYMVENGDGKNYCFDYIDHTNPIALLDLSKLTRGILGMITVVYCCDTEEEQEKILKKYEHNDKIRKLYQYKTLMMNEE